MQSYLRAKPFKMRNERFFWTRPSLLKTPYSDRKPVIRYFVALSRCKICQFRVDRVTFVSYMRRKGTRLVSQQTFLIICSPGIGKSRPFAPKSGI